MKKTRKSTLPRVRKDAALAAALSEIAASINSSLDLDQVLDNILTHLAHFTVFDAVNLMLLEGETVRIERFQGYAERGLEGYAYRFSRRVDEVSTLAWIYHNRRGLVIPDTELEPSWLVFPETGWIRSYAGIPIIHKEERIGFLNLNSATPGFYDPTILDRLRPFADQCAVAIANARAFAASQLNNQRLAIINKVSSMLNQPLQLEAVLQATVEGIAEALHLEQVTLSLWDEGSRRLAIAAERGRPGIPAVVGRAVLVEGNLLLEGMLADKKSLLITDAPGDPRLDAFRQDVHNRGALSILMVPLVLRGRVLGLVSCAIHEAGRQFGPEEVELAETLCNMATLRIEQARLFAEERQRTAELTMLHAISLDITLAHELPVLLRTIVERAVKLLNADCGTLYQCYPASQRLECKISLNEAYDRVGCVQAYGEGAAGAVAGTGRPLIVPNYPAWSGRPAGLPGYHQPFAVLSVPMSWQEQVTGVIQVIRTEGKPPFAQGEVDLLSLFSNYAAIALENARLVNNIQQMAIEDMQTGLFNRRGLVELGEREISRARRFGRPLAGLMLDGDNFKRVNDEYGHWAGDMVLIGLADLCRRYLRSIDVIGRYGGDEYVILLPEIDLAAAAQVAERLRAAVQDTAIQAGSHQISISVSIGVAMLEDGMPGLEALIQAADQALYAAKRAGRNQVHALG